MSPSPSDEAFGSIHLLQTSNSLTSSTILDGFDIIACGLLDPDKQGLRKAAFFSSIFYSLLSKVSTIRVRVSRRRLCDSGFRSSISTPHVLVADASRFVNSKLCFFFPRSKRPISQCRSPRLLVLKFATSSSSCQIGAFLLELF